MFKHLPVPVDGSARAMEALKLACALASPDARTHLLNVRELPPASEEPGRWMEAANPDANREDAEKAAERLLNETASAVDETAVEFSTTVRWGPTAQAIVKEAERLSVDAIVMGSRGLSDLAGLVMGSVSHRVMHSAGCRVILVR